MRDGHTSRRGFLGASCALAGAALLEPSSLLGSASSSPGQAASAMRDTPADYTLTIATTPIELAPDRIISTTNYNGQFPGPLLRFKEGQRVTIDIHNQTDRPELVHWHGQFVPADVDGAAEEGSPFVPPHGSRRISFVPGPSGLRFYHTHVRAGADLSCWTVQRTRRPRVHRAETRAWRIRPRSLSHAQGVPAHTQPWRRYGDGLPIACRDRRSPQRSG